MLSKMGNVAESLDESVSTVVLQIHLVLADLNRGVNTPGSNDSSALTSSSWLQ